MILVDTCVWIDYFRDKRTPATDLLREFEGQADADICISSIIYFEILRGISNPRRRRFVAEALNRLERRDCPFSSVETMIRYDLLCRRHGVNLPKLGDWLIIQTALDHHLELLSSDRDFARILPYVPLQLVRI